MSSTGWNPHVVILDEAAAWVRSVELVDQTGDDRRPDGSALTTRILPCKGSLTVEFNAVATGWRELLEAAFVAQRTVMVARLADDLGRPGFLVRRQVDAVDRVLEEAGVADGYGQLCPAATRRAVPLPSRWS
ncbi:hypothetical protein ACFW91_25065 [Streptomyces asoensis]|uniref:hypothetical protein n=1 Tax=Streptomyces asoensis TaxID=249586 RepID=UPI0036C9763F